MTHVHIHIHRRTADAGFDESKHPRDGGKFATKAGAGKKDDEKPEAMTDREAYLYELKNITGSAADVRRTTKRLADVRAKIAAARKRNGGKWDDLDEHAALTREFQNAVVLNDKAKRLASGSKGPGSARAMSHGETRIGAK